MLRYWLLVGLLALTSCASPGFEKQNRQEEKMEYVKDIEWFYVNIFGLELPIPLPGQFSRQSGNFVKNYYNAFDELSKALGKGIWSVREFNEKYKPLFEKYGIQRYRISVGAPKAKDKDAIVYFKDKKGIEYYVAIEDGKRVFNVRIPKSLAEKYVSEMAVE